MKLSLNWLSDFITLNENVSIEDLAWRLTEATSEVEKIHHRGETLRDIVVGEVLSIHKHPESEKLSVAKVKVSKEKTITLVFGRKAEVQVGDKLPTAIAPATLHAGDVKVSDIKGISSQGMLCLNSELLEDMPEELTKFPSGTKVGTPITDLLPLLDTIIEIDNHSITHRADLFSQFGYCRELIALGLATWKKKAGLPNLKKYHGAHPLPFKVSFESTELAKRYYGTIVEGLDNRPSPPWMQYRLQACGIRAINALVDITNYVMLETGAPMHAFDVASIPGKDFLFRLSKENESMTTLDGKQRKLPADVMVVESNNTIIDLVGIMGAENSEVKISTTSVYFHQGIYNPQLIRKAMISLGHRTDAGTIFEKGIHPELSEEGMHRTLELVKEIFPKAVFKHEMVHVNNAKEHTQTIELQIEKLEKHLGLKIHMPEAKHILESLGCSVKARKTSIMVTVPTWRKNNITIPEDLVEEVGRIYGLSNIPAKLPSMNMKRSVRNKKRNIVRSLQQSLIGQGFYEERNFAFISEHLNLQLGLEAKDSWAEIANPVTEDFKYMRPSLLPYLLKNVSRNLRSYPEWRSFELGKIFTATEDDVKEETILSIIISLPDEKQNIFAHAKGTLTTLSHLLGINCNLVKDPNHMAYPGRSVRIEAQDKSIGKMFRLHPKTAKAFGITAPVGIIELSIDALEETSLQTIFYKSISRFPEVTLDLSVVVDAEREMKEIEDIIGEVEPDLLKNITLKDIYTGENIGQEKKSFTFALTYQSNQKTLEEKEIQETLNGLIAELEKSNAVVRR